MKKTFFAYKHFMSALLMAVCTLSFTSCGSDDDDETPSFENMEILSGSSASIENGEKISWTSQQPLIASVSGNTVTGHIIGTTTISSVSGSFSVTVKPANTLYDEPCLEWGASKGRVKSFMQSYTEKSDDYIDNSKNILDYYGTKGAYLYKYGFENNKLKAAAVFVKTYYVEALVKHLSERYVKVDTDDDNIYMIDLDKKTIVIISTEKLNGTYYYTVMYGEFSNSNKMKNSPFINATTRTADIGSNERKELMNAFDAELNKLSSIK